MDFGEHEGFGLLVCVVVWEGGWEGCYGGYVCEMVFLNTVQ